MSILSMNSLALQRSLGTVASVQAPNSQPQQILGSQNQIKAGHLQKLGEGRPALMLFHLSTTFRLNQVGNRYVCKG